MHFPLFRRSLTRGLALSSGQIQDSQADVPGTVCQRTLKSPPGPTTDCGFGGTLANPSQIGKFSQLSLDRCVSRCFQTTGCESFSLEKKVCRTYSKSLKNMGYEESHHGNLKYYNKACYLQTCPNLLANNGNFENSPPSWSPWVSSGDAGLQEGFGTGFQSPVAGTSALASNASQYNPLFYQAVYAINITFGQLYSFSLDYKPMIAGCATYLADADLTNRFLVLGSYNGTAGTQVTVGQWGHYTSSFVLSPFASNPQFQLITICPGVGSEQNPPAEAAFYDNFVSRPLPVATYTSQSKTTGANLVNNPGFDSMNLNGYHVKRTNAQTSFTSPGYNNSAYALSIAIPQTTSFSFLLAENGVLLSQTLPTQAGKVYFVSFAYKASTTDTANPTFDCTFSAILFDSAESLESLYTSNVDTVPVLAIGSFTAVQGNVGWTVAEGYFSSAIDNEQIVLVAACDAGDQITLAIDALEVLEFA